MNVLKDRFSQKRDKTYYTREFVLNHTIPGIVLSETVLSGDPLYCFLCNKKKKSHLHALIKIAPHLFQFGHFSYIHVISNCRLIRDVRVLFTFSTSNAFLAGPGKNRI